jgi:hypothetical protein
MVSYQREERKTLAAEGHQPTARVKGKVVVGPLPVGTLAHEGLCLQIRKITILNRDLLIVKYHIDNIFGIIYSIIILKKGGDRLKQVIVRVPDSLHRELKEEAKKEGVSLNQLCLTKLARPLDWYRQKSIENMKGKED